jgi:hypothetical protein
MSTNNHDHSREDEIARLVAQWSVSETEARRMLALIEASKEELGDAHNGFGTPGDEGT